MELFTRDAEVIGTNGVKPGVDEWYTDCVSARELVQGDWEGWGDLRLDLDSMSIHSRGDVVWVAAPTTEDDLRGKDVYDVQGQRIGSVEDLYIERKEREVRFLEVGAGTARVHARDAKLEGVRGPLG